MFMTHTDEVTKQTGMGVFDACAHAFLSIFLFVCPYIKSTQMYCTDILSYFENSGDYSHLNW